ncbi:MAG: DUF4214 domain-containing protein, partial [Candidatus Igneacidithiobacillus chanchocoensis]
IERYMKINHITEIFSFSEREFIRVAYENLLGRAPDEQGMRYYLGRLALGYSRSSIIFQLARSAEAKNLSSIQGLPGLLKQERFRQSGLGRLLVFFGRGRRQSAQLLSDQFGAISAHLDRAANQLASAVELFAQFFAQWQASRENVVNRIERSTSSIRPELQVATNPTPPLSKDDVTRAFHRILGRAPESAVVIEAHRHFPNLNALQQHLRQSAEYQARTASLTPAARRAYHQLRAALPAPELEF